MPSTRDQATIADYREPNLCHICDKFTEKTSEIAEVLKSYNGFSQRVNSIRGKLDTKSPRKVLRSSPWARRFFSDFFSMISKATLVLISNKAFGQKPNLR
jgi:hypothetical protein